MNSSTTNGGVKASGSPQSRCAPVIEHAPLPMVEVEGPEHTVCFVNAAFCRLLDKTREELLGQRFVDLTCNGPQCAEVLDRVYSTGAPETLMHPDAATPAFWLYAMWPALDEKQKPERVIIQLTKAVQFRQNAAEVNEALLLSGLRQHELRTAAEQSNHDLQTEVIERRRIAAELEAAQRELRANAEVLEKTVVERTAQLQASLGELEAFAYSLAHDLRAPVRAIHGFTQIVLETSAAQLAPDAAELLHRVLKAAIRMDSLIQDVLALSHVIKRPIRLVAVDVDSLAHALVRERPELSPPRAEITIASPLLPVIGHEATLSQALTNLLSNGVKFVGAGSVPRVRVWTEKIAAGTPMAGSHVRIWVEDQGIGIPVESQSRIFEIFQRLHTAAQYEGSGIGLAIVRKAAERMGGRAGVKSQPGQGSRFWLELPAA